MSKLSIKVLSIAAVLGAVAPAAASAATLDGTGASPLGQITFTSRGKAADLAIPLGSTPTITENGSTLHASGTCTAIDAHNASCPTTDATVVLGGGADTSKTAVNGNLSVDGGPGDDRVLASGLHASVTGDGGDDLLIASSNSNTTIDGGAGADTLYATGPSATLTGDDGKDTIYADTATPAVDGGDGADSIAMLRSTPAATVAGGNGPDLIAAFTDSRFLIAGGTYDGGAGNDVINVFGDGSGTDHVTCGDGNDTVYADAGDAVAADCETVVNAAPPAGSAIAALPAQAAAFKAARTGIPYTPGPLMPGF